MGRMWNAFLLLTRTLAQAAILATTVIIIVDDVMRLVFHASLNWSFEVNALLVLFLGTFVAADVLNDGTHISMSFFEERLRGRRKLIIKLIQHVAGVVFCGVLSYYLCGYTWMAFKYDNRISSELGTPLAIPDGLTAIAFIGLTIQFFILAVRVVRSLVKMK